jgi:DNA-binding XRE family transcriptional regulator
MPATRFGKLLNHYMRRIRARAKDVADELGVSRQTVLNWIQGTSMPKKCSKVMICAQFLRLTETEIDELFTAANCDKRSRYEVVNFASRLFIELSHLTSYPVMLLLSQTDCSAHFFRQLLLREAEEKYSINQVLHIHTPFFTGTNMSRYFVEFGKQCRFKEVNNEFNFERALQKRLEQGKPLFLLVTRFEQGPPILREQLAGILHNLSDLYPDHLHVLLCGGEKLAELKYRTSNLALLTHATVKRWPEMTRAEVYALRDYRFRGLWLDDNMVDELLTISGAQPQLLDECLRIKQQQPQLEFWEYPGTLSESDCVWQLFTPFTQDTLTKQQLTKWLQQEELGKAHPYIFDDLLRQLYWKNLLVERNKRLYWRCDTLRIAGLKILGNNIVNN